MSYCYLFILAIILSAGVHASSLHSGIQEAFDYEEDIPFTPLIIKHNELDQPLCNHQCEKKLLLGISFNYQSNLARSSNNSPKQIIESNEIFPYHEERNLLNTSNLKFKNSHTLTSYIIAAKLNSKAMILFSDVHGIEKNNKYPQGGILIPEKKTCIKLKSMLEKYRQLLKSPLPPEQYQINLKQYNTIYSKYHKGLCHDRILPYQDFEAALKGPILFHFNSIDPVPIMERKKLENDYALFNSHLGGGLKELIYFDFNHQKTTKVNVYRGKSRYLEQLEKIKNCRYDLDHNGQIQFNEVYKELQYVYFTEGLKRPANEKLYNWNLDVVRALIKRKETDLPSLFKSISKDYSKSYQQTEIAPGFSVIYNLSNCPPPPFELANSAAIAQRESLAYQYRAGDISPLQHNFISDMQQLDKKLVINDRPLKIKAEKVKKIIQNPTTTSQGSLTSNLIDADGLSFIQLVEGSKIDKKSGHYQIYNDFDGNPVLGYGHQLSPQEYDDITSQYPDKLIPKEVVDQYLQEDLVYFAKGVDKYVNPPKGLNQNQRNALLSFTYNMGVGGMKKSTLVELINSGASLERIKEEWLKYSYGRNKQGERVFLNGLYQRRLKEWELFIKGL